MTLIVTVFTLLPIGNENPGRQKLEDSINVLNRAVRFSVNESILRNVLVRLKLNLESTPVEYSVEYGSGPELILPTAVDMDKLSYSEREAAGEKAKKFDSQFTAISEFTDGPSNLPEGIEVYAVGTSYNPILITSGQASIYFYPTGEKDSSLIILNNDEMELFEKLRIMRMDLAKDGNLPPYVIAHDSVLKKLAKFKPMKKEEMLVIEGIGEKLFDKYGPYFLKVIRTFVIDKEE